ncbi:MAG: putative nucleotidyltransferase substrate binding domain-containing protein [bacterium]
MSTNALSPELRMVQEFLGRCLPFTELPDDELAWAAAHIRIRYLRKGQIIEPDNQASHLAILRSGAVDVRSADGELLERLGEGESINLNNLAKERADVRVAVIDDALIYELDAEALNHIRSRYRNVDRFFHGQRARRLRRAARYTDGMPQLLTPVADIVQHSPVGISPVDSVQEAARLMSENRVSSLLVLKGNDLCGILTDRDIRTRVVAPGLDFSTPVETVMTRSPEALSEKSTLFDAMITMSEKHIHHLPVLSDGVPISVVTTTDLIRASRRDPVFLIRALTRKSSVTGLAEVAAELPEMVIGLVKEGVSADQVSHFICAISDGITRRLIELAESELGPPPAEYAWLGFGSQGRKEIALGGDQDNALVISNDLRPEDEAYFEKLANFVCDGLNACGYPYCNGGIMAANPLWRLPLKQWRETVSGWVRSPTDDAVMRVSIFFDIRCIAGNTDLAKQLQIHMLETAAPNSIFLAALARNALFNRPPLGFFRRFVVERNGEHQDMLDLKHRGIIPVVDLARVHAIANKVEAVNTLERLDRLSALKVIALRDARNLQDALNFVMQMRLEEQCRRITRGESSGNFVNPDDLGDLSRKQLRDAFRVIHDGQETVSLAFSAGTF